MPFAPILLPFNPNGLQIQVEIGRIPLYTIIYIRNARCKDTAQEGRETGAAQHPF